MSSEAPVASQVSLLRDWKDYVSSFRQDPSWYAGVDRVRGVTRFALAAPHWFVFTLLCVFAVLPQMPAWRRYCRRHRGLCEKCGYDLRASPERCPECGTPRTKAVRPSTSGEAPDATKNGPPGDANAGAPAATESGPPGG